MMKLNTYIVALLLSLLSNLSIAASYTIKMSELDFSEVLPITGSCEMDIVGEVTDLPGSQMCISSSSASVAQYRIIAAINTNFTVQVNSRLPQNGDGITFTPIGKITSDVDDIDIIPGQAHLVSSGLAGRVDITFGGQIIISREYTPNTFHEIDMEDLITWLEVP